MLNPKNLQHGMILCLVFVLVCLLFPANVYADGASDTASFMNEAFNFGSNIGTASGGGTGLPAKLYEILSGLITAAHSIIIIMTLVAGAMVVFGMEDGKKIIWQYMLGIGLAINFAGFLYELWSGYFLAVPDKSTIDNSQLDKIVQIKTNGGLDILSTFMAYYTTLIVKQGQDILVPIALRMTLIFAAIDASIKLAMDLISGDKVKFMISTILKVGFYMFLIEEWITLAEAISKFFQTVGFMASAVSDGSGDADNATGMKADSITNNAISMWNTIISGAKHGGSAATSTTTGTILSAVRSPITGIGTLVIMLVTVACLFLTAVEMFMARIEFYTMMLISIIMIPFGVIEQLNFLGKQAISSVFNLGAKVMVIAFIQGVATTLLAKYVEKLGETSGSTSLAGNFPVLFQILLLSIILLVITKKIPDLVSGFLQGSPNLSGGSMVDQAASAVQTAGKVTGGAGKAAGMVAGAYAQAKGNATASGKTGAALKMSTMAGTVGNLAGAGLMAAATGNPLVQGVNSGLVKALGAGGLVSSLNKPPEKDKNKAGLPGFRSILSGGSRENDGFNYYNDTKNNISPDKQNESQNTNTSKPISAEAAASGNANTSNTGSAGAPSSVNTSSSNSAAQKSTGSSNEKNTLNTTNSGDKGNTGNTGNTGNATNQQPNLQGGRETKKDNDKPFQPK